MISTIVLIGVAVLLAFTFRAARRARIRQRKLEREVESMKRELDVHREKARSILRELQNV
jgi:uncharacterized membrane-anchored protein YhcB (DUF1043 family)